jgi:hypothetical protein
MADSVTKAPAPWPISRCSGSEPSLIRPGGDARPKRVGRLPDRGGGYLRMLIARAATRTASTRLAADSISISIFAQRLSGIVSVGLNAVAFVNET